MAKLRFYSDVSQFLSRVKPELSRERTLHSFLISMIERFEQTGKKPALMFEAVSRSGDFVAAGMQTEVAYSLIISNAEPSHAAEIATDLSQAYRTIAGVTGPLPAVERFSEIWTSENSVQIKNASDLRLFELSRLLQPQGVSGFAREAKQPDLQLVFDWLNLFHQEAVPHDASPSPEQLKLRIEDSIRKKLYYIWEDQGKAVCLLGANRETEFERWIAPVYTPRMLRGQGYAQALVASTCEKIIQSGKKVLLFTDLSNPISNRLYTRLGFEPFGDFRNVYFSE